MYLYLVLNRKVNMTLKKAAAIVEVSEPPLQIKVKLSSLAFINKTCLILSLATVVPRVKPCKSKPVLFLTGSVCFDVFVYFVHFVKLYRLNHGFNATLMGRQSPHN